MTHFPYGIMFLILTVLGLAAKSYSLAVERYAAALTAAEARAGALPKEHLGFAKETFQQASTK